MPNYTEIASKGAYSADAVYTAQDVAHIVSYAGAVRSLSSISFAHNTISPG